MIVARSEWPLGSGPVVVPSDEVLCVRARLDGWLDADDSLAEMLSPEESSRAARFAFPGDRRRYIASHALLRELLAACIGVEPRSVSFERGAFGKPIVARRLGAPWLRFNMSASRDVALYAIAREREVGVDVEYRDDALADALLAAPILSASSRAEISALPPGLRNAAFYDRWSRLEALGKAEGWGLLRPMEARRGRGREWTLFDCAPEPGYSAALAVEGGGITLARRSLAPVPSLVVSR